jgi:hypothetical protein
VLHHFNILAAVVCVVCLGYLLLSPVEKEEFFLTRLIAQWIFPKLDRRDRHRKLEYIAGVLFATFLIAAIVAFLINRFGRG